jgi:hypothetical protein
VLSGTRLLTRDDRDRLYLWDIKSPDNQVELRNPGHEVMFYIQSDFVCCADIPRCCSSQPERPLEAIVQHRFAIIVRPALLEIYGIPEQALKNRSVIYPAAYHQWQWKLDSVCISLQASWAAAQRKQLAPIGILVRYGSLLPWVRRLTFHDVQAA